ncbi:DNA-binding protein [Ralstonia pickettii]|jgi:chromosome segregation ATPase|uniref:DNA-binding protein n=3 Tax=Burkholderiaceae TaxID=119060 RepID=A0AAW4QA12_RALPI|nr:DNA-binding protein [Ralstonia pickettii]UNK04256.1 DNA-binding protein [Ralstonia insidiosa]MBA9847869.1 DNA-binding protein [Ralstonia pickettii]MBA9853447.1 DNA-binding protein [Ralstonia pickettii]MBX3877462.1 DNA-binding protein [Ralstonia pickettii]MBX3892832.1 DNA-binding protein [Ralstonia pickettii]
MRPAEFTTEQIIQAGQALQDAGRNVTGFALRQKVGGGNPSRLKQVWDEHLASKSVTQDEPVAELPVEVAEEVKAVTAALTERITQLAAELNDKAVKAAERRVAEVLRAAGEQREQAERELADAATTVDDLEATLDTTKAEVETLAGKLAESQANGQAQAVELAQLRERLSAAEAATKAAAEKHQAELVKLRAELDNAEQARSQAVAELGTTKIELARVQQHAADLELATKTTAEKHEADTAALRGELEAAEKAHHAVDAELSAVKIELARVQQHAADLELATKTTAEKHEADTAALRGELEAAEKAHHAVDAELSAVKIELARAQQNASGLEASLKEQKQRSIEVIGKLEDGKQRLERELDEARREAKEASNALARASGEADTLRSQVASQEATIRGFNKKPDSGK